MLYLCRRKAALGNLKASFHCARLHFLCRRKAASQQKYSSKLDILHSICIFFAPSTNESAQGASQEASITTKGGHNRRQAPVIY